MSLEDFKLHKGEMPEGSSSLKIPDGQTDLLEGKGAAIQLLGSAKTSLLGRGAAEQQELVGGVHEFQLLSQ